MSNPVLLNFILIDERVFINGINTRKSEAWEVLYARYYSTLCRYAMKVLDDNELATDLVQNVIIHLWERPVNFESMAAFQVYIYRAVNNNCLQHIRNKNREDKRLQDWAFFTDNIDSESLSAVVHEEVVRKLYLLIDQLSERRREVLLLSMKKMSNEEISEALGVTVHAVKKYKREAYAFIRHALGVDFIYFLFLFKEKQLIN